MLMLENQGCWMPIKCFFSLLNCKNNLRIIYAPKTCFVYLLASLRSKVLETMNFSFDYTYNAELVL